MADSIEQEPSAADAAVADLRTLVGGMTGNPEAVSALDEGSLRALSTVLLDRMAFARQSGIGFHGERDYYEVLGYNRLISYREYRAEYMRGGIAKRVVDAYPTAVWRGGAEVYEDEDPETETEFEAAWKVMDARLGLWTRFKRVHTLSELSTYAVLLIGAPGELADPLPNGTPDKLLYVQPFSGGGGPNGGDRNGDNRSRSMNADCTIETFDTDPKSERFGQPQTYRLKRTNVAAPQDARPVHWSRIIHVADGLLGDEVYGTPILEAVWNYLQDLLKVVGGGAEAFWLRANAGLHIDFDKTMGMPSPKVGSAGVPGVEPEERKRVREQAEHLQHQLQRVMVTRGANVTQLSSATANFKDPSDAIITLIAGTIGIPKRLLVGAEAGQLASGQDKDNWNTQVQDKRTTWAFPGLVKAFIDRLIQFGYLPKPKQYEVEWPVIEDLTKDEKVKLQLDMAAVNDKQQAVVYTEEEIREVMGSEPLTETQLAAGLSEVQKADIADKLANANKAMGLTLFTDDEIRKISYGFDPLDPSEIVPIGAPERISVTSPPKLGEDGQPIPQQGQVVTPVPVKPSPTVMQAQLVALEAAIEADDLDAIVEILGLGGPGSGPHKGEPSHGQSSALGQKADTLQKAAEKSGNKDDYAKAAAAHQAAADSHKAGYRSTLADIHQQLAIKMKAKS